MAKFLNHHYHYCHPHHHHYHYIHYLKLPLEMRLVQAVLVLVLAPEVNILPKKQKEIVHFWQKIEEKRKKYIIFKSNKSPCFHALKVFFRSCTLYCNVQINSFTVLVYTVQKRFLQEYSPCLSSAAFGRPWFQLLLLLDPSSEMNILQLMVWLWEE